jgi:hypothetical protein
MSGMTLAVPSWDILDTLEVEQLKKRREADDRWLTNDQKSRRVE